MADNAKLYENYKTNAIEGSVLRVGVLNTFMNDFDVEQLGLKYVLDKQVKAGVTMAFEKMKKSGIQIVDIDFDLNEFSNIGLLVFRIIAGKPQCGQACVKQTWNAYLGDSERFDTSAPYHSYEEFLNKSTLSTFWREYFERGNIDDMCQSSCADFDSARMDFAATVKSWYNRFNVDTIMYPSISNLPFAIKPEIGFTNFDDLSATFFSPYTGFSALNVPIGFSKRTDKAPDGLPMGLTMLTPTKSFAKAILIAKKFETEFLNGKYPLLPRGFA
jgi:Asp-tRNA(Asn)/Glu-tRNA(Gln) amidotransferase A subunit family amidase